MIDAEVRPTDIGTGRPGQTAAALVELGGRTVAWFRLAGEVERTTGSEGAGIAGAEVVLRTLELAGDLGVPAVGVIESIHMRPTELGALGAWGRVAQRAAALSGVVPLLLAVSGPCHGGLAPLFGLVDHVVFTRGASAYVNGPAAVAATTGMAITPDELGGGGVHARMSGLATLLAPDEAEAVALLGELLSYLPDNRMVPPPHHTTSDPDERLCLDAVAAVPAGRRIAYDVRRVLADVVDGGSLLEVYPDHAANVVTAYATVSGRPVALIANQPCHRAGTLDIAASSKAARHVQGADSANLPLLTFVDTPGFEPGRDLEWRGMIRHGAELVHAYAAATVPRICVVLRKAYGGAYIVMDSKGIGSDVVLCWPQAEIAVMGARGAVAILNRGDVAASTDPAARQLELEDDYEQQFCTPRLAAERGYVDKVVEPAATRAEVAAALRRLSTKQPRVPNRRHANTPC